MTSNEVSPKHLSFSGDDDEDEESAALLQSFLDAETRLSALPLVDQLPDDANIELELCKTRDSFASLKFRFLEADTRLRFLEHITKNEEAALNGDETGAADQALTESRQRLKTLKENTRSLEKQLKNYAQSLAEVYEIFQRQKSSLQEKVESLHHTKQHHRDEAAAAMDHEQVMEDQLSNIRSMSNREVELSSEADDIKGNIDALKNAISNAESRLSDLSKDQVASIPPDLRQMQEWYASVATQIFAYSGIKVREVDDSGRVSLNVVVNTIETKVELQMDGSCRLQSGQVYGIDATDIVLVAVERNDLPFLFRELRRRMKGRSLIEKELNDIRKNHENAIVDISDVGGGKSKVTVKLDGVRVVVDVPREYPDNSAVISGTEISGTIAILVEKHVVH